MAKGSQPPWPDPQRRRYEPYLPANRTLWDAWTRLHLAPGVYGVEAFTAGGSTLKPLELAEVGDVAGKTLLHLQCHLGLDTLSWARRGAVVTRVDFTPESIAAGRALSQALAIPARFVCSDVFGLPQAPELADERFDCHLKLAGDAEHASRLRRWLAPEVPPRLERRLDAVQTLVQAQGGARER